MAALQEAIVDTSVKSVEGCRYLNPVAAKDMEDGSAPDRHRLGQLRAPDATNNSPADLAFSDQSSDRSVLCLPPG